MPLSSPAVPREPPHDADVPAAPSRPWATAAAVVSALALLAAVELALPALPLSRRTTVALLALLLAAAGWRRRRTLLERTVFVPLALLFAASLLLAGATATGVAGDPSYIAAGALWPVLAGWTIALWLLPAAGRARPAEWRRWSPAPGHVAAVVAFTVIVVAAMRAYVHARWAFEGDEITYLLQSRWTAERGFGWSVDPAIERHFRWGRLGYFDGRFVGMYPPGWPALLAVFSAAGLLRWCGALLGGLSTYLTYRLGRRVHSPAAGMLAALLLAVQPWFLMMFVGYGSHAATIPLGLGAALFVLEAEAHANRRGRLAAAAAGLLLGVATTVRPLTGVALATSLLLWIALRRRVGARRFAGAVALVCAGALPPAAGLLLYNATAFGEPFTVSYLALNGGTFNLGFGARGFSVLDESLNRVAPTAVFTPWRGVRTMLAHLGRANHTLAPIGLLFPIVALALAYTRTVRWRTLLAFSPLVLVHVFYFGTVMRFYSELFPFLFVGLAGTVVALALHDGRLASAIAVVLLAGSLLLFAPGRASELPPTPWTRVRFWGSPGRVDTRAAVEALQREHGRLLVFVRGERGWEGSFDYLYGYNAGGFAGAILVARDLGDDANRSLMRRFPDRAAFLAISPGRGEPAALLRLMQ